MLKIVTRYILVYENRKDEESAKSSVMNLLPIFCCINCTVVDKLSFATVNRWENGRAIPNKLAQSTLYELCKMNNVPVYDMVLDKIKEETEDIRIEDG